VNYFLKLCFEKLSGDVILKNFLSKKPFFYTTTALSAIAAFLWFIQLCAYIEADTGFYINRSGFGKRLFVTLFIIVLAVAFIFGFVWNRIVRKRALLPINMKFNFTSLFNERLTFAVATIGFAINTFYEIYRLLNPLPSLTLEKTINFFSAATAIFSAASLIFFIIMSFLIENKGVANSAFSIVIVTWVVFRIIRDFIGLTTVYYIPKNLLDIIYLCFLLITSFSLCRLLSDTDTSKGYRLFTIYAPITIVLGFVLSVPAIFGFILRFDTVSTSDAFMNFVNLTLSVFFLRVAMHLYKEN